MKQNKTIIIIAVALIALILVAAGTAAALLQKPEQDQYAVYLSDGYRYLQAGDYDNAILQFRLAMEEDDTREDAYIGLYQAYLHSYQWEYANTTLRIGIRTTQSTKLQELLIQFEQLNSQYHEQTPAETKPPVRQEQEAWIPPIMNTDMLGLFASANYGDYCTQYGSDNNVATNGRYSRYLEELGATILFYDTSSARVIDTSRGVPYSQYLPNEIWLDEIATVFGGSNRITFENLLALPGVTDAVWEDSLIRFRCMGCEISITCEEKGVITDGCANKIVPLNAEGATIGQYEIRTAFYDATNNAPISGVKVRVYQGSGAYGDYKEVTTDTAGTFSLKVDASGEYTMVAEKDGYISEQFQVIILSNVALTTQNLYLSPVMNAQSMRFVLTWGAAPSDLDLYLIGTSSSGVPVQVFFGDKVALDGSGNKIADLDVDDTTSYGPETITLNDIGGSYDVVVDDYTDSGTIGVSGATLKVYIGSDLVSVIEINPAVEDLWNVCNISNGDCWVINQPY